MGCFQVFTKPFINLVQQGWSSFITMIKRYDTGLMRSLQLLTPFKQQREITWKIQAWMGSEITSCAIKPTRNCQLSEFMKTHSRWKSKYNIWESHTFELQIIMYRTFSCYCTSRTYELCCKFCKWLSEISSTSLDFIRYYHTYNIDCFCICISWFWNRCFPSHHCLIFTDLKQRRSILQFYTF